MTTGEAWFVTIVLALVLVLGMGAVELAADAMVPGAEVERYEKTWCKGPSGTLEACAIKIVP
ncbi:hypothetical protein LCGC14_1359100 [marine sediment metagenome]|uniref:Uncharacterized protein n=1 Tax=marine sediment metagenome TaxID=412755 RepID=A0A0F9MP08_9ZZZZ